MGSHLGHDDIEDMMGNMDRNTVLLTVQIGFSLLMTGIIYFTIFS
jgi:hypothetical protein